MRQYSIRWISQISEVPQQEWDVLAQPLKTPFLEWEWLHNMEASGSATAQAGWQPCHLTVWHDRTLVAAAPLYVKGHSYGEFVFDHQWADLAYRLGIEYYPKLLGMSPFTPALGYRFLVDPTEDEESLTEIMVAAIDQFCDRHDISGCNFLYVDPKWKPMIQKYGFSGWLHHSSIWHNQGFQTFDDYLGMFNANQRRNIKRERKAIQKAQLTMKVHNGEEITHNLLSDMYHFYSHHCDQFGWWGSKYLTKTFFERLYDRYRHRLVLSAAYREGNDRKPVGMSFCVTKADQLYGRYWGSFEELDCLHFNACYYTPIEWAIANGIQRFDPGAGGRHKKRRGFPATPHHSLHRFYNQRLMQIMKTHIDQINEAEQLQIDAINEELPFNQTQDWVQHPY
ncbi:GNAT family N-acetyltransferase [Roseofilum reptotaenium CS-1145]|uniref:GNAT family N-acetyltransferase n=1 Tax=Roseofilum reptotaenium AO1-A TaxID=1925591 RepID=A0A1L9QNN6_9CYAN|nr:MULTISPECIES: GNAT family N-acetyltransferase [Roseofilum]MBP0029975.1 N-acetyltransferase [Roseofilum sp. Guam]MDB9517593.1 GNAT family N-acetyltransferase [Roseofilum reptotaenium CS-1145]OJJ24281.1 GNAT family N-acetyltransferase [Roseofilum reptotaenium AO1-A]